jgi:hypothetical protein
LDMTDIQVQNLRRGRVPPRWSATSRRLSLPYRGGERLCASCPTRWRVPPGSIVAPEARFDEDDDQSARLRLDAHELAPLSPQYLPEPRRRLYHELPCELNRTLQVRELFVSPKSDGTSPHATTFPSSSSIKELRSLEKREQVLALEWLGQVGVAPSR